MGVPIAIACRRAHRPSAPRQSQSSPACRRDLTAFAFADKDAHDVHNPTAYSIIQWSNGLTRAEQLERLRLSKRKPCTLPQARTPRTVADRLWPHMRADTDTRHIISNRIKYTHTTSHDSTESPINQPTNGPHRATHGQGEATSQHSHRGQQTLRHEVLQAWGANNESRQHLACATDSCSKPFYSGVQ